MKEVIDNFSTGGADYALYRPDSPPERFLTLFTATCKRTLILHGRGLRGTGNGQVAAILAERFKTVYGTDISDDQLKYAVQKDNIIYRKERVEQTTFTDNSIDLITVAQAIHWFDFGPFYNEVRRVS